MSNIETPEEFAESVTQIVEYNAKHKYRPRTGVVKSITARTTARDAQYLALLKMCWEALELGREKVQRWVNEIYDAGGIEYIGLGSTLDKIDKALAALREAGVKL